MNVFIHLSYTALHYSVVLLLYYSTVLCEALRIYMDLCHTDSILID